MNRRTLLKSLNEAGPVAFEKATLELPYLYELLPLCRLRDKHNLYEKIATILKDLGLLQEANEIAKMEEGWEDIVCLPYIPHDSGTPSVPYDFSEEKRDG